MWGRTPAVVCFAALLAAPNAGAATVLAFDREVAEPGDTVEVTGIEGRESAVPPGEDPAITVYLVRLDLVEELLGPGDMPVQREPEVGEGVILLGVLEPHADSVGRLSFSVPELQPGRYTTGVWCVSCGGTFETSYRPGVTPPGERGLVLRVVAAGSAAAEEGSASGTAARGVLGLLLLGAAGLVVFLLVTNRRRRQSVLR